ncbi:hypothetical protein ABZX40_31715 [Streptomyces sp. NPDC004610]|uniref:hypothetical protein n=1 Tax=unclassified Streptomyces TaxID=2593676 RepID=UPI0033ADA1CC
MARREGVHLHLGEATEQTQAGRVLDGLALRDRAHAVVFAPGQGLVGPDGR